MFAELALIMILQYSLSSNRERIHHFRLLTQSMQKSRFGLFLFKHRNSLKVQFPLEHSIVPSKAILRKQDTIKNVKLK